MENKVNYLWIGIFVFSCFFASLFFIVWIGNFSDKEKFIYYQIYTRESVSGLGLKAPVRLLGVDVGSVEDLRIDTQKGIGVRILIKVREDTPVTKDTLAILQLQGITGLKFIELSGGEDGSQKLENGGTIQVKESLFSAIDKQSDKLFNLLDLSDKKIRAILSDENIASISLLIKHSANFFENLDKNSKQLNLAIQKVSSAADSIYKTSNRFGTLADDFQEAKSGVNENLKLLQMFMIQMNELAQNLKQSPSDILFKSTKSRLAPGER